jgi:hypothetical protein
MSRAVSITIASLLLVAIQLATSSGFTQSASSTPRQKNKNNTLSIITSLHEFFDGSPIMQAYRPKGIGWTNLAFGLEYDRKIAGRHGFILATTFAAIRYYSPYVHKAGDMVDRGGLLFDGAYQYRFYQTTRNQIAALLGVNFRYGYEDAAAALYVNHIVLHSYDLADLGISLGVRGSHVLFSNFVLTGDLRYAQYVYVHSPFANQYGLVLHNRPTRNMLTLQLGLGYQF